MSRPSARVMALLGVALVFALTLVACTLVVAVPRWRVIGRDGPGIDFPPEPDWILFSRLEDRVSSL